MADKEIVVMFNCCSEKDPLACLGFGLEVKSLSEDVLLESVYDNPECFADAFWEMAREYESGVEKAKELLKSGAVSTMLDAIKEVFGHFYFSYQIDESSTELNWDFDDWIYSWIEQLF